MSASLRLLPPTRLIVLDVIGALLTGLGLAGGLSDALDRMIPPFADKTNAWICAAFGALMMTYAAAQIVRWAIVSARRS